jgi:iron(III) transport system permease protein
MGKNSYECFFRICIPMALPGIAAGLALALMETLNDYGVADFFGLQTLTVGVFQYISVINDIPSAYLLSLVVLLLMLVLYAFEIKMRGKKSFHNSSYEHIQWSRYQLGYIKTILVLCFVSVPIIFGYVIPVVFTLFLIIKNFVLIDFRNYFSSLSNSIILGIFVAMGCICLSIFINYISRFSKSTWFNFYKKLINMGYALPGVVIALGVLVFINLFDLYSPILLSTSIFGLILALIIRLISISNNSLQSGLDKIGKSIDDASRLIGRRPSTTYFRIIIPQIKLSILAGFFLVLVDTIKELPITLLLRPFNFNTLATSLYEYSSNEMFELGSLHALTIILFLSAAIYVFDSFLEKRIILKDKK